MIMVGEGEKMEPQKSKNHLFFLNGQEYFTSELDGSLFRAPVHNYIDVSGYRAGARWQVPSHLVDSYIESLKGE